MTKEELMPKVVDFVEMEHRSCSINVITAECVARCLQLSLEDTTWALNELKHG